MPTSVTGVIPTAEEYNDLVTQEELTTAIDTLSSELSSSSGGTLIGTTAGTLEARFVADEAKTVKILAPSDTDPETANEGDQYFNTIDNLNKIYRSGSWIINDSANLASELASENGSSLVNHRDRTVQNLLDSAQVGKDVVPGYPGTITAIPTAYSDMTDINLAVPNGPLISDNPILYTEIPPTDYAFKRFQLRGQGKYQSVLNLVNGTSIGGGWQVRARGFEYGEIKDLGFDSASFTQTGNGTLSIENSKYFDARDIYINGGYDFSAYMANAYACKFENIHVRGQRHWSGNAKAGLLTGNSSTFCRVNNGTVDCHATDGTIAFQGDLADSDLASHGFFVGNTLIGPTYSEKSSGAACLYAEGQESRSNMISSFNVCYGNGVGAASTELSIHTGIGNILVAQQQRGVWDRNHFTSLGSQYMDILLEGGISYTKGAFNIDDGTWGASIGDTYKGNLRDFSDYSGISTADTASTLSIVGTAFASLYQAYIGTSREQLSVIGCRIDRTSGSSATSDFVVGGSRCNFYMAGTGVQGTLGNMGANSSANQQTIVGSTINGNSTSDYMINVVNQGTLVVRDSAIKNFLGGLSATNPINKICYEKVKFINVTFNANDLLQKYRDCTFVSCTNAPISVTCGSFAKSPEQFKFEFVATAGQALTIPAWLAQSNGLYHVIIEGTNGNAFGEYIIAKTTAATVLTGPNSTVLESTAGKYLISWPKDSNPVITFTDAGTYQVRFF